MNAVPTGDDRGLLQGLLKARAFEALCSELPALPAYPPGDLRRIAPAVPAAFALRRATDGTGDLFTLRRGSPAAALLFGLPPEALFRQALGRASAPAGGRDPGGFPTDLSRGLLGPVPGAGTLVEVMAGAALAFRLRGQDRVALLVDDLAGCASGFWHEGLNVATASRAPLVLVVDAGHAGEHDAPPAPPLVDRAAAYGMEARRVFLDDALNLSRQVAEAVERAREGLGVQLVETVVQDPDADLIATLAGRLRWAEAVTDDEVEMWGHDAVREMEEALARVLAEPLPEPSQAGAAVYAGDPPTPDAPIRS